MKYAIIHVNDRAKENMEYNKAILKDLEYVNGIDFFYGNTGNAWDILNHRKIRTDVWNPYDGRAFPPLPGEYGIWVSTINVWDYIITNDIDTMLVLEDDIDLVEGFVDTLKEVSKELPDGWDFLSLSQPRDHTKQQNMLDKNTDMGLEFIHKSLNQYANCEAILYSKPGVIKLRRLVQRKGIEYTSDCFMFEQSRLGYVSGYSIIPNKAVFLKETKKEIKSLIDPENVRNP